MFTLTCLLLSLGPSLAAEDQLEWGDFDADGLRDLVVVRPGSSLSLLRNQGDGTFADVTARVGLGGLRSPNLGLWRDADGDRDLDLLVVDGGSLALLSNEAGVFVDATPRAGLDGVEGVRSAEWLDFDRDGRADLQVSTAAGTVLLRGGESGRFAPVELGLGALGALGERAGAVRAAAPEEPVSTTSATTTSGAPAGGPPSNPPGGVVPPGGGSMQLAFCPTGISDYNLGGCVYASLVPTLGLLFALSVDLNVDGAGNVGMGTTTPGTKLDVIGDVRSSGQLISTVNSGAPLQVSSSALVKSLNADLLDGLDASSFSQFGTSVSGAEIADGTITDADISSSAAIAGEKIDPYFGDQDVGTKGRLSVGSSVADVRLHVVGGTDVSPTGGGSLQAGSSSGLNLALDENEIMARSNGTTAPLHLNAEGGPVVISGGSSTGRLAVGTNSPTGRLHVVDSSGGDSSVVLPSGSISSAEMADEPGLASGQKSISTLLSSTHKTIMSHSITAPTDGYVIATVTLDEVSTPGGKPVFSLETSATGVSNFFGPGYAPGGFNARRTVTFHRVFQVNKGNRTFYLNGSLTIVATSTTVYDPRITLLYVPGAYGTVTP